MIKRKGKYYFLWSSGKWSKGDYHVNYGVADSPLGPFYKENEILTTDHTIANSPGHNGYIYLPESDEYYMVYHRRPMEETTRDARVLCIDRMYFQADQIKPVEMT
jgi:beta-xylosidase